MTLVGNKGVGLNLPGGAGAVGPPGPPGAPGAPGTNGTNGSRFVGIQILLPGAVSYTPSPGVSTAIVHAIGGGGGGGGSQIAVLGARAAGGGGGSGAYGFRVCSVTPGVPIPCSVGSSGASGSAAGGNGGNGGTTTIGPFPIGGFTITAPGGSGGKGLISSSTENIAPGGYGGIVGSGGSYNGYGSQGQPGLRIDAGTEAIGGAGGVSPFGSGGPAGWTGAVPTSTAGGGGGSNGIGSGGGGGTTIGGAALSGASGGFGDRGGLVIYEYADATQTPETNSIVLRPALPTTNQAGRALPAASLFEGGIYESDLAVTLTAIRLRATAASAGSQVRIAIYQTADGTLGVPLPLILDALTPVLGAGAQDLIFVVPATLLRVGQYAVLIGRNVPAQSTTIRVYGTQTMDGFNTDVPAGRLPYTFTTAISSAAPAPATFDPLTQGIASTSNLYPAIRGGN